VTIAQTGDDRMGAIGGPMPRLAIGVVSLFFSCACGVEPVVIHQSGSFTVLQDPLGGSIGGLNTDEQVIVPFADQAPHVDMRRPGDLAPRFLKHAPMPAPTATMRLERSVLHVHLPPGEVAATFGVSVTFRKGLLTRFHPDADVWVNGQLQPPGGPYYPLFYPWPTDETVSSLIWSKVIAGGVGDVDGLTNTVPTEQAPLLVDAALLAVGEQRQNALSYRGLGHLDAPLRAQYLYPREYGLSVTLSESAAQEKTMTTLPELWLVDVRDDGTAAVHHRVEQPVSDAGFEFIDDQFAEAEYSRTVLPKLWQELHAALIKDGLFADETQDLLHARHISHLTSPGRRLLFLAPQTWTDAHLPLTISREARIVRSMVGCIELVTDAHEAAITRIAAGPVSQPGWYYDLIRRELIDGSDGKPAWQPGSAERIASLFAGEAGVLQRLQVEVPEDYAAYLSLGRFRDTLLIEHLRRTGDPELAQFRETYLVDQTRAMVNAAADGNGRVKLKSPRP
jgi:hypothetical protein